MARSVAGYNMEAKKGRDEARKYCQAWQFELTKLGAVLIADFTNKKITQAVYNFKREELNRQTEDLNKCINSMNAQVLRK
ncbi:MAG: hypothetical protein FWE27_01595 [Defluviitaleaceae bacterium]|nr:hypothetical protein [Defluviitaleaceae bacterium]